MDYYETDIREAIKKCILALDMEIAQATRAILDNTLTEYLSLGLKPFIEVNKYLDLLSLRERLVSKLDEMDKNQVN